MSPKDAWRIRVGMILFVLGGPLSIIGLHMRGPVVVANDPALFDTWAMVNSTAVHELAWVLLLPNLVIQIFAWIALWAFMRGTRYEGLAFWGSMLSIAGNALFLTHTGVLAYTEPMLARLYLDYGALAESAGPAAAEIAAQAQVHMVGLANTIVTGPLGGILLPISGFALFIGGIVHSFMLLRAPQLPTWTAVPYVLHAFCLTLGIVHYAVELAGGYLLAISTIGIAWAVWKRTRPEPKAPAAAPATA